MAEIQHKQIRQRLTDQIIPLLDVADLSAHGAVQKTATSLSRAMAVAALMTLTDVTAEHAANSLVDGPGDNGIDLIYYDTGTKTLFLVQSKWSDSHTSSVDLAGILKFLAGVGDLVSTKKERFNEKVQSRWVGILDALDKLSSVVLVVAYPGSGKVDSTIQEKINDFVELQNDTSELFFFRAVAQKEFFQFLAKEASPANINLQVRLSHYGNVDSPLKAVYGQVSASDVAGWYIENGNNLFSGNIRHFLGERSDVNAGISDTLSKQPDSFWYFNNGITLIAEKITRQAIGSADKSIGVFDCKNVSIVNGAQTVGTIGRTLKGNSSTAFLQARIIEVTDPESALGMNITRASNTQNRIDARNFVALDPQQDRIRTELLIDKISYEFREGELLETSADGFEFVEAITVLACAQDDISLVALAKRYVGGLYADINSPPYKTLFNSGTSAERLWGLVQLIRRVEKRIKETYDPGVPLERGVVVHGNRFLNHCILRKLGVPSAGAVPTKSDRELEVAVSTTLDLTKTAYALWYLEAYAAPLFKNVSKCTKMRELVEGPQPMPSPPLEPASVSPP